MSVKNWSAKLALGSVMIACSESAVAHEALRPAPARGQAAVAPIAETRAAPAPVGAPLPPEGMIYVPAGTFMMGLPEEITGNKPVKTSVKAFFLDRLEVSTAQYVACVQTGACEPAKKCHREANATAKTPRPSHPINCVTYAQATRYCAQLSKRLPTESEWEFAARGTDGRIYPWGNETPAKQLCWDRGRTRGTCPVGSFPAAASAFGALDMAGNVGEWTASPETEVAGPGAFRTRGGGYVVEAMSRLGYDVRSDRRDSRDGEDAFPDTGFRCAKDG